MSDTDLDPSMGSGNSSVICRKSLALKLLDFTLFPLRALSSHSMVERLGLTSLKRERIRAVWPYVAGRVLDVGCGDSELIHTYKGAGGSGVGVDVYPWEGADICCDTRHLPFEDQSFDTVTMLAVLNHVPQESREAVLAECGRVLRPGGGLVITMLSPLVGRLRHAIAWWDPDKRRQWHTGEAFGLSKRRVAGAVETTGFALSTTKRFVYGLNRLYVCVKAGSSVDSGGQTC